MLLTRIPENKLGKIKLDYLKKVKPHIEQYLKEGNNSCPVINGFKKEIKNNKDEILKSYYEYMNNKLDSIILGEDLEEIRSSYSSAVTIAALNNITSHIFVKLGYEKLRKEYLPSLGKELGIKICPYCGANYIRTIRMKNKVIKALYQFDHIISKDNSAILALSFYNLIPCCATCNHQKSNNNFKFNPYSKGDKFSSKYEFTLKNLNFVRDFYSIDSTDDKVAILIKSTKATEKKEIENVLDILNIESIYNCHDDYIAELVLKTRLFDDTFLTLIKVILNKNQYIVGEAELLRLLYGYSMTEADDNTKIMAKFTRDIVNYLKK